MSQSNRSFYFLKNPKQYVLRCGEKLKCQGLFTAPLRSNALEWQDIHPYAKWFEALRRQPLDQIYLTNRATLEIIDTGQLCPITRGEITMKEEIEFDLKKCKRAINQRKANESKHFRNTLKKHDKFYFSILVIGIIVIFAWWLI